MPKLLRVIVTKYYDIFDKSDKVANLIEHDDAILIPRLQPKVFEKTNDELGFLFQHFVICCSSIDFSNDLPSYHSKSLE